MEIKKHVGAEKEMKWEIIKVLLANNPGHDFGVNPGEVSDEMELNGYIATAIEVGHALKNMGFREKISPGKVWRKIYVKRLKELEYEMVGDDLNTIEKMKPTLTYIYNIGYDVNNKEMVKYHDEVPEPIRVKIGKWFCQTPKVEINDYLEKCKIQGSISKKILED